LNKGDTLIYSLSVWRN